MDCIWSEFGNWSECSKTCGGGERFSTRTIIQQTVQEGKECKGEEKQVESCNEDPCPGKITQPSNYNQGKICCLKIQDNTITIK